MIKSNRFALPAGVIAGLVLAWLGLAGQATAHHYHPASVGNYGQTWDDCGVSFGCIGWKYFSPYPPGVTYISANPLNDGSPASFAFSNALSYWNSQAGTVASFSMNGTPQNYPAARLVPYRLPAGPAGASAQEVTYDQNPNTGTFATCDYNCVEPGTGTAYPGYDLSELIFFDAGFNALSTYHQLGIAKHELGHTLGLRDHNNDASCINYTGLMGQNPRSCQTWQVTCVERQSVNQVHDRALPC